MNPKMKIAPTQSFIQLANLKNRESSAQPQTWVTTWVELYQTGNCQDATGRQIC